MLAKDLVALLCCLLFYIVNVDRARLCWHIWNTHFLYRILFSIKPPLCLVTMGARKQQPIGCSNAQCCRHLIRNGFPNIPLIIFVMVCTFMITETHLFVLSGNFQVARQLCISIHPDNLHLPSPLTSLGEYEIPLRLPRSIPRPEGKLQWTLNVKIRRKWIDMNDSFSYDNHHRNILWLTGCFNFLSMFHVVGLCSKPPQSCHHSFSAFIIFVFLMRDNLLFTYDVRFSFLSFFLSFFSLFVKL